MQDPVKPHEVAKLAGSNRKQQHELRVVIAGLSESMKLDEQVKLVETDTHNGDPHVIFERFLPSFEYAEHLLSNFALEVARILREGVVWDFQFFRVLHQAIGSVARLRYPLTQV